MAKTNTKKAPAKSPKAPAKKPAAKPTRKASAAKKGARKMPAPVGKAKAPNISEKELETARTMARRLDGVASGELAKRLGVKAPRASHILRKLSDRGQVQLEGITRNARYHAPRLA